MNLKPSLRTASHHLTWFLGTRCAASIPLVFVVGYPKSGTTWACQLVADYLQLPFPRYSLLPVGFPAVVHGHERVWKSYKKGVYVVRDGRDALVSMYFFMTAGIPEGDYPPMTAQQRRMLPGFVNKANVSDNIAAFVKRQMTTPHSARANWGDHVRSYFEVNNPNIVLLRYETLLQDGETALAAAMAQLTGEEPDPKRVCDTLKKFSFRTQSKRPAGQEDRSSFLRKGQPGDWVNHFTPQAAEIFDTYCGEMLIAADYEPDHSWVQTLGERPRDPGQTTPGRPAGDTP